MFQALLHASVACHRKLIVDWIPASDLEETTAQEVIQASFSLKIYWLVSERDIYILLNRIPMLTKLLGIS